jgi:hypothetical protein
MKTRKELEQLNDEQEMLEFFSEYHKFEIDMAKMKMLHALHDLKDGIGKIYEEQTKGMTPEQIKDWQEDAENEEDDSDSKWNVAWDSLLDDIQKQHKYSMDIEVDEYSVTITYMTKFFHIRWGGSLCGEKPKLSEMEKGFEIELTDDAHFLIDLATALIYEHAQEG